MITFVLFEGDNENDNSMVMEFRSKKKALEAFKASPWAYVLLNKYEGSKGDEMATYIKTIAERP